MQPLMSRYNSVDQSNEQDYPKLNGPSDESYSAGCFAHFVLIAAGS